MMNPNGVTSTNLSLLNRALNRAWSSPVVADAAVRGVSSPTDSSIFASRARLILSELPKNIPEKVDALFRLAEEFEPIRAAFAGKNTDGSTIGKHTRAVMIQALTEMSRKPKTLALVQPYLVAFAFGVLFHDIGKGLSIERDGNSESQKSDTEMWLDAHLAPLGFSQSEQAVIRQLGQVSVSKGAYRFRAHFDEDEHVAYLSQFAQSLNLELDTFLAMALSLFCADASYYPNVNAASFVTCADGLRRIDDAHLQGLRSLLKGRVSEFPVDEFFVSGAMVSGAFFDEGVLKARVDNNETPGIGMVAIAAAFEFPKASFYAPTFDKFNLTQRIGIDVRAASTDDIEAVIDRIRNTRAPSRTLVVVRGDSREQFQPIINAAEAAGCTTFMVGTVDMLKEASLPLPRADFVFFGNNSKWTDLAFTSCLPVDDFQG